VVLLEDFYWPILAILLLESDKEEFSHRGYDMMDYINVRPKADA